MRNNQKGTTMISVIISFALLLLFVTSYFQIQKTIQNMIMTSRDTVVNNRGLIREYYLGNLDEATVAQEERVTLSGENGSFTMTVTMNKATSDTYTGTIYAYQVETE